MSYKSPIPVTIIIFCLVLSCKTENVDPTKADTKIYGGTFAKQENTLHQVSIRIIKTEESKGFGAGHNCGGSLISPQLVLTAAHCMYAMEIIFEPPFIKFREYTKTELAIVMGTLDRTNRTENTIIRATADWVIHPKYDREGVSNDVAIIKLNESVPLDIPTIKPISILGSSELTSGTICSVSGWGVIENKTAPAHLLSVDVPVVSVSRCNASDSYNGTIDNGMICAGNMLQGLIDSCQGDSGGPFVCNKVLHGIVSFGNGCGLPFFPGVYTKVAYFKDWITTESNRLSPPPKEEGGGNNNGTDTGGNNGSNRAISSFLGILLAVFIVTNIL